MKKGQVWESELYDSKLGFVSELGKGVVDLLAPQNAERILDIGCGTGDLTNEISATGAEVTGMDLSGEMLAKARQKYPHLQFLQENAEHFNLDKTFDAVFSNAALHWMRNADGVVRSVHQVLQPGGRFVAEFGGQNNVQTVIQALYEVLQEEYSIDAGELNPWYYPSIGEYSTLLEEHGFRVTYAVHFDRPTPMNDGDQGLYHWLNGFSGSFFKPFDQEEKDSIYQKIAVKTKPALFHDGTWYIDYKRIRVRAIKY
ncbi:methyltransferase domain-containing protein [Neobacillus mesonae]|nr:methyltransferase domain-containing protein [Neobacillus mesonae]